MTAVCTKCMSTKPLEAFGKDNRKKNGRESWCRACRAEANAKRARERRDSELHEADKALRRERYAQKPREYLPPTPEQKAHLAAIQRRHYLKRTYGLTPEEFQRMSRQQRHRCAICNHKTKLYVDHCHKTGAIRGLICNPCNRGLGMFKDKIRNLEGAISYLRNVSTPV